MASKGFSCGRSQILLRDYDDPYEVETIICEMVEEAAARLRRYNVAKELSYSHILDEMEQKESRHVDVTMQEIYIAK